MAPEREKKPVAKTVLNALSTVVSLFLVFFVIYMLFLIFTGMRNNEQPTVFNHQIYIVQSDSMSPTFKTGSVIIVKVINPQSVKVGDIITFKKKNDSVPTTHRVVEIIEENNTRQFITKGDANNMNDPTPVAENFLIGKVVLSIPKLGYVMAFIRTKNGIFTVMLIPVFIVLITQIAGLLKVRKKYKSEVDGNIKPGT
ncbi:S26 family signal peptidase [Thermoclostridium stercorarium subsp. leptospartum DSM 9219]|uniref:Signal peptidase I n=1 Tax=Thermoclostridium stercorarium subsp. leptospartum DSM 9219 TaxID=1346611 RepID=A0A1B1YK90_THEST|nr:signal peptidase I [Thermoclostridium stercorarium]ANX01207.1 S26 family signal peptidase [Thermoclostridium stercorarium subsp. leptospartum DSM 9219]